MNMKETQSLQFSIIGRSNAQTEQWEKNSRTFLARFDDLDKFLNEAEIVVRYYFGQQNEISDYGKYREFLKKMLKRYIFIYTLPTYEEKKRFSDEGDGLDEKYHQLINFGVFNPVEARNERLETWISIEEQKVQPKGLVLRYKDAVKRVLGEN